MVHPPCLYTSVCNNSVSPHSPGSMLNTWWWSARKFLRHSACSGFSSPDTSTISSSLCFQQSMFLLIITHTNCFHQLQAQSERSGSSTLSTHCSVPTCTTAQCSAGMHRDWTSVTEVIGTTASPMDLSVGSWCTLVWPGPTHQIWLSYPSSHGAWKGSDHSFRCLVWWLEILLL